MGLLGIRPAQSGSGYTIPTETAATTFGLLAGVAGGAAQLLVSKRLSQITPDRISLRSLAIPLAIGGIGTVAGALLVPGGS